MLKLIELSTSEFIFFITDDDYFLPGSIKKIMDVTDGGMEKINAFRVKIATHLILSNKIFDNEIEVSNNIFDHSSQMNIFKSSHIFSGCAVRKSAIPDYFNSRYNDFYFTTSLLFGANIGKLSLIPDICIIHTWENEIYWDFANHGDNAISDNWNYMCEFLKLEEAKNYIETGKALHNKGFLKKLFNKIFK